MKLHRIHKYHLIILFSFFLMGFLRAKSDSSFVSNDSSQIDNDTKIFIYFGGDVTFAEHFEQHVQYNFEYPFNNLKWFKDADISMVNLENPLTKRGHPVEKQFNFRALPEYTKVLKSGGIDIVTIANNHIFDYDALGLYDTIVYLDSCGIKHVGAGKNLDDARAPVIFRVKGLKIGFLGYYGLRKHSDCYPATSNSPGTALRKLIYIKSDVDKLKKKADFIVVNFHWGIEKQNYPEDDQIVFAHQVIDYGADLIIGHHPHVLQGIELYHGKMIVYSLGNFIFGGNSRKTYQTAIVGIKINKFNPNIYNADIIPIQVDYWQPHKLYNVDSLKVLEQIKEYSSVFKQSIF